MRNKVLLLTIVALMSLSVAYSLNNDSRSLGIQFGSISGSGYSMRWIGETHGMLATIGASTSGDDKVSFPTTMYPDDFDETGNTVNYTRTGRKTNVVLGLGYVHILDRTNSTRFYITAGGSYKWAWEKKFTRQYNLNNNTNIYSIDPNVAMIEDTVKKDKWTVGFGPGFEFTLDKHFKVTFDLPITVNNDEEVVMYIPQLGLHYYFK